MESIWMSITSRVPQELILAPIPFVILFDDLDNGAKCALSKFAGNTQLGEVANTVDDWRNSWKEHNEFQQG